MSSVIVFGPTGNIGRFVAQTAHEHGAKVWLAMRDTQKTIPGLSSEDEKNGRYERVEADLSKPETVTAAIEHSQAKRAFLYVVHGSQDHMKGSVSALKAAGVEFVVLLSSFTIDRDLKAIEPQDAIPYVHAQAELTLDEIYGPENYVAVRPGTFATNNLRYLSDIKSGNVHMFIPHVFKTDNITPDDMGRVSGTILVKGPKNGQTKVYLYGPSEVSVWQSIQEIGQVLGKHITLTELNEEQAEEQLNQQHMPKPFTAYMMRTLVKVRDSPDAVQRTEHEQGVKNVELYTGKPSVAFKEWVANNKALFE